VAYLGDNWYARINQVRQAAARLIGAAAPDEIAFVANTSSGLSMVAKGIDWHPGDEVVITNVEYPANRYPWLDLQRLGVKVVEAEQDADGRVTAQAMLAKVTAHTRLVAVSHVQYGSGYRIDLAALSRGVHAAGALLCVDAIQSVGAMPVDVQALGVDFLAADGHKWMLGPEGAGIFYCRSDLIQTLHPSVVGWMNMVDGLNFDTYRFEYATNARRFEPGSFNVPGILALGASIDLLLETGPGEVWRRIHEAACYACDALREEGWRVFSPRAFEAECSGIVSFSPPGECGVTPEQIVARLKEQKVIIAPRAGRLRISPHFYNSKGQIDRMMQALSEIA
jgi:selenocysteine lyase/cysteine desulfurase